MNTTASVYGAPEPIITSETVFDSESHKRGRGRPKKHTPGPTNVEAVDSPVAQGTISDVLKSNATAKPENTGFWSVTPTITYKIVHDGKPDDLAAKVNTLLKDSWQLHGGLITTPNGLFVQAMYKSA
jgi:hypothetical protein